MPPQYRVVSILVLWVTTALAGASGQSTPVDPGRWAYPQEAAIQSDPGLIGDYVPCLFDVDQHRTFRAIKIPAVEEAAQSQAKKVVQSSSSLSETEKAQVSSDISGLMLSALSPDKIVDTIKRSTVQALDAGGLAPDVKNNIADSVAHNVAITVQQGSPIKRPADVSCGMSVLPWNVTRWSFGREIAENFIVVQVTVRNLNDQQQFLVHDVELAVDTQPGIFNRFNSSTDQATVDGVALTAEEGWSSRGFWLRLATFVGNIVSAASVPVGGPSFKDAAGIYSGAFIPGLNKFLKDHTAEQIARLDSSVFTNSQSRKVIVSKNDSATFDTFLPVQNLLQIDWEKIYYYKTGAKVVAPNADFILSKPKAYKDWNPLALLGLDNSTYIIVSGAHISEASSQAQFSSFSCPPDDGPSIDLPKLTGESLTCSTKGTNLQAVSQVILENAKDSNDHAYAVGTPSVSGADPTQATISFKVTELQQLKGTSYKVFYELKGGSPQATSLVVAIRQIVSITPDSLAFSTQINTASTAQASALTNRGTASLSVTGVTITGTNSAEFAQTNTCGASVASGANCTISVTFRPTSTGAKTASVNIADSAPGSPHVIALTGTGTPAPAPAVTLSLASIAFASETINTTSAAQVVTLTNSGNAALSVTGVTITGTNSAEFAQTNTCGASVASGANCTISVTFRPTSTGAKTASVSIADNAAGSPQLIALTGTGTPAAAPAVTLSLASLAFASQTINTTSAAQVVTLTNSGNAALSVTGVTITGTNSAEFAQTNTCGASVASGANCTISVTFRPASTGAKTASVNLADSASNSPQAISLTGTAQ